MFLYGIAVFLISRNRTEEYVIAAITVSSIIFAGIRELKSVKLDRDGNWKTPPATMHLMKLSCLLRHAFCNRIGKDKAIPMMIKTGNSISVTISDNHFHA